MTVQPDEYMPKTVEHCQFMNRFLARVSETDQTWAASDDFILVKPRLSVKLKVPPLHSPSPAAPKLGREVRVVATFTNPLSIDLTSCSFSVEGPGFIPPTKKHYRSAHTECGRQDIFLCTPFLVQKANAFTFSPTPSRALTTRCHEYSAGLSGHLQGNLGAFKVCDKWAFRQKKPSLKVKGSFS